MNVVKRIPDETPTDIDDRCCPQEDVHDKTTSDFTDHSITIPGQQRGSQWSRSSDGGTRTNSATEGETNDLRQQPLQGEGAPNWKGELEVEDDRGGYDKGTQDAFIRGLSVSTTPERLEERSTIVGTSGQYEKQHNKQVCVVGPSMRGVATVRLVSSDPSGSAHSRRGLVLATRTWPIAAPLGQLRRRLAAEASLPEHVLQLSVDGALVEDETCLGDVGVTSNSSVMVYVTSNSPQLHPALFTKEDDDLLEESYDVITVHLPREGGGCRAVVVEVEWQCSPKPWLGGYRHRFTGLHYHHASSQTTRSTHRTDSMSRAQQTAPSCHAGTQTLRACSTQTTQYPFIHADTRILIPFSRPGYSWKAIVRVQAIVRAWLARRRFRWLQEQDYALRQVQTQLDDEEEVASGKEHDSALEPDDHSCPNIHLRSAATKVTLLKEHDSALEPDDHSCPNIHLRSAATKQSASSGAGTSTYTTSLTHAYERLDAWRRQNAERVIASTEPGRDRSAALLDLLRQETGLLRKMEQRRAAALARKKTHQLNAFLREVSGPQHWPVSGGGTVEVETPNTRPLAILASVAASLTSSTDTTTRLDHLQQLQTALSDLTSGRGDPAVVARVEDSARGLSLRGVALLSQGTTDGSLKELWSRLHEMLLRLLQEANGAATCRC